ncbi:hypothetical protein JCM11641_007238 [Rhodosporidiobolus odoratus]
MDANRGTFFFESCFPVRLFRILRHHLWRVALSDLRKNVTVAASQLKLLEALAVKLADDRSLIPVVNTLFGGEEHPATGHAALDSLERRSSVTSSHAGVDVARLEEVIAHNAFTFPASTKGHESARRPLPRRLILQPFFTSRPAAPRPDLVLPYHLSAEMYPFDPRTVGEGARYDLKALEAAGTVLETSKDGVKIVSAPVCAQGLAVEYLLLIAFRRSPVKSAKEGKETRV